MTKGAAVVALGLTGLRLLGGAVLGNVASHVAFVTSGFLFTVQTGLWALARDMT